MAMGSIQILIVDDHPVVRRGLKSLLSNYEDFVVIGEAGTLTQAQDLISTHTIDVVILDVRLQDESGLDLLDWIKTQNLGIRVIMLTSFSDEEYVTHALQSGASGFILKSGSDELLCDAIRAVYHNGHVMSSRITEQLILSYINQDTQPDTLEFSEEELKILRLLVDGASNDAIANELFMSVASVKRRLQKIFGKLGANNRSLAIAEAVRRKLLS